MASDTSWIFPALLIGGLSVAFGPQLIERMHNEVTVYNLYCTTERVGGVCKGEEQTGNPTKFKVYPEQQLVVEWVGDGPVTRLEHCAVRDVMNWRCQNGHFEHTMTDGNYTSTAEPPFAGFSQIFYQGSRFQWWLIRAIEYTKTK